MEIQTAPLAVLSKIDFAKVVGQQATIAFAVTAGSLAGITVVGASIVVIDSIIEKRKASKNKNN